MIGKNWDEDESQVVVVVESINKVARLTVNVSMGSLRVAELVVK